MPGGAHEHMKAWEPEEDRMIIELLASLGPRWSKICKALPGRSISSIRNRWQRIDKGRKLREEVCENEHTPAPPPSVAEPVPAGDDKEHRQHRCDRGEHADQSGRRRPRQHRQYSILCCRRRGE